MANNGSLSGNGNFGNVTNDGSITSAGNFSSILNRGSIFPDKDADDVAIQGCLDISGDLDWDGGDIFIMVAHISTNPCPNGDYSFISVGGAVTITSNPTMFFILPGSSELPPDMYEVQFWGGTAPGITGITYSGLGDWTIDNDGRTIRLDNTFLPVELLDFQAQLQEDKSVALSWQTASETNNEGFDVERSPDGRHWEKLGFVAGYGTTQETQSYSYLDREPHPGINYYRLLQKDFDGQSEYSEVVNVELSTVADWRDAFRVYPNPVLGDEVQITILQEIESPLRWALYSPMGQLLTEGEVAPTNNSIKIDDLPTGTYALKLMTNGYWHTERLVIQH